MMSHSINKVLNTISLVLQADGTTQVCYRIEQVRGCDGLNTTARQGICCNALLGDVNKIEIEAGG